ICTIPVVPRPGTRVGANTGDLHRIDPHPGQHLQRFGVPDGIRQGVERFLLRVTDNEQEVAPVIGTRGRGLRVILSACRGGRQSASDCQKVTAIPECWTHHQSPFGRNATASTPWGEYIRPCSKRRVTSGCCEGGSILMACLRSEGREFCQAINRSVVRAISSGSKATRSSTK